jgi:hypothetical protein
MARRLARAKEVGRDDERTPRGQKLCDCVRSVGEIRQDRARSGEVSVEGDLERYGKVRVERRWWSLDSWLGLRALPQEEVYCRQR